MIPGIDDRSFRPVAIINYSPFRRGGKKKVGGRGRGKKKKKEEGEILRDDEIIFSFFRLER